MHEKLYTCVIGMKLGYKRYIAVHAWVGKGNRLGMPANVQVSWHNSTAHTQRLSSPK